MLISVLISRVNPELTGNTGVRSVQMTSQARVNDTIKKLMKPRGDSIYVFLLLQQAFPWQIAYPLATYSALFSLTSFHVLIPLQKLFCMRLPDCFTVALATLLFSFVVRCNSQHLQFARSQKKKKKKLFA